MADLGRFGLIGPIVSRGLLARKKCGERSRQTHTYAKKPWVPVRNEPSQLPAQLSRSRQKREFSACRSAKVAAGEAPAKRQTVGAMQQQQPGQTAPAKVNLSKEEREKLIIEV
jgi:hypothetical protein